MRKESSYKRRERKCRSRSFISFIFLFFFLRRRYYVRRPVCLSIYTLQLATAAGRTAAPICRPLSCDDRSPFHFHALKRVNISKKHRRAELYNPSCTAESRYLNTDCCAHTDVVQSSDAQHPPLVISLVF